MSKLLLVLAALAVVAEARHHRTVRPGHGRKVSKLFSTLFARKKTGNCSITKKEDGPMRNYAQSVSRQHISMMKSTKRGKHIMTHRLRRGERID